MRTVSLRLIDLEKANIPVGFVGENEHTQVRIDCLKIYEEYPSAAASLTVKPPKGDPYPAVVVRDGNVVVWEIKDSDLVYPGSGEIQLAFTSGETIAKSFKGRIKILDAIVPSGEVPEPLEDFLTEASAALTAIPETINTALAEAKASGEFDGKDGEDGQDGHSPVVTATKVEKVTTISVDGEPIVTINDGVDGQDGTDGTDGADGHTPVLTAIKVGGVTTVYSDGVQIAQINDGQNGSNGADGYSPTATVSKVGKVSTLTVTDKNGTTSVQINDGQDGQGGDVIDDTSTASDKAWSAQKVNSELSSVNSAISAKYTKPENGIPATDLASGVIPSVPVTDVQVNGTSVLSSGVASIPMADTSNYGAVKINTSYGISYQSGCICVRNASEELCKGGTNIWRPITASVQKASTFYGLASASGDTTQSSSSNAVGVYTEDAKSKIHDMLDAPVSVSGSTPSITAKAGCRYVCGEVSTLTIVVPASGIIDVTFTSGSTATVLTITPPTGQTVKWANGFDPTSLDANTVYEVNILDGEYGVACSWT